MVRSELKTKYDNFLAAYSVTILIASLISLALFSMYQTVDTYVFHVFYGFPTALALVFTLFIYKSYRAFFCRFFRGTKSTQIFDTIIALSAFTAALLLARKLELGNSFTISTVVIVFVIILLSSKSVSNAFDKISPFIGLDIGTLLTRAGNRFLKIVGLLMSFSIFIVFPAITIGSLIGVCNGCFDNSLPKTHHQTIVKKRYCYTVSLITSSDSYTALVTSWRTNGQLESFSVSKDDYEAIELNKSTLTVTTKKGAFGYEWIVNYKVNDYIY